MVPSEQAPSCGAEYYNGSLLPFFVDQTSDMMEGQCCYGDTTLAASGFSEVQMNGIYDVTANTQTDASAFFNHDPLRIHPLIDVSELRSYDCSFERSGLPFSCRSQDISGNGGLDNFGQLNHWMPKEETVSSGTYMDIEWQQAELQQSPTFQLQAVNMNRACEFQSNLKEVADTSYVFPKPLKTMSRENRERSEVESRRRFTISQRVQALQELLPGTLKKQDKRCNQESVLHDVIGHIKYLQLQLKELSRSRLGGESSSDQLKFIEGYGHYYAHEQKFNEPLEEKLGSLFEMNPMVARKLLESNDLYMVPMASVDALVDF